MQTVILASMIRVLMPLMALSSVFLLLRGHNEPGGGFVGGLVLATGVIGYAVVFGSDAARKVLRVPARTITGFGLLIAIASGLIAFVQGDAFLTSRGYWVTWDLPGGSVMKVGPPLLFDLGVYLTVAGVCTAFVLRLLAATQQPFDAE